MAEDLDDLLSLDHLLDETFLLREGSLLCHHVAGACTAEFLRDGQHESGEEAHNESHPDLSLIHIYIIFCGENITVNRQKYVMDESIDSELEQFYQSLNETEEKYN